MSQAGHEHASTDNPKDWTFNEATARITDSPSALKMTRFNEAAATRIEAALYNTSSATKTLLLDAPLQ